MKSIVVTGAAGFIGSSVCTGFLERGFNVKGIDNFSRPGSRKRASELAQRGIEVAELDVANRDDLLDYFRELPCAPDGILHLAAQTAVTRSFLDPAVDFDSNALGTFNVFEATRICHPQSHIIYSSSNKVLGPGPFTAPVSGSQALAPSTPYGISKAVGDYYAEELSRSPFSLRVTCLRQSCIYGPGQLGTEDQGWVAWFGLANLLGKPITIFGDGKQIRDLLFITDLVDLYTSILEDGLTGTFVVGGGASRAINVSQVVQIIEGTTGVPFSSVRWDVARLDDQDYFVSDNSLLQQSLDWTPVIEVREGIVKLIEWQREHLGELTGRI